MIATAMGTWLHVGMARSSRVMSATAGKYLILMLGASPFPSTDTVGAQVRGGPIFSIMVSPLIMLTNQRGLTNHELVDL